MTRGLLPVIVAALTVPALAQQPPAQTPQPRPPIFRAGAHYVRVDAYPTDRNGRIVAGLTRDDFEVYEDGRLQSLESAEYVAFDTWTPDGERKDPRTQQDAYDLAADPTWRVFVIVIDRFAYDMAGQQFLRAPLHQFIDRNLGPRDLFGLLSTENEWTDLTLGQTTTAANAVLDSRRWLDPDDTFDERWTPYYNCGLGNLIARKRLDDTYSLLEGLVRLLTLIRQERKSIIFVTRSLDEPASRGLATTPMPTVPGGAGVARGGGGSGITTRGDRIGTRASENFCTAERLRLMNIDFPQRFRDLLAAARQGNVSFNPVSPDGLIAPPFHPTGGVDMPAFHHQLALADRLISLASETGGIAVVNTNDLAGGLRRIASDMQAYYVLGYYTNNTKWDGGVRTIKVRLKPKGEAIRARRQYRAPTMAEISAMSPAPPRPPSAEDKALADLEIARLGGAIARQQADFAGEPVLFRNGTATASLVCQRTDRIRIEFALAPAADPPRLRLLDRRGQPLAVPLDARVDTRSDGSRVFVAQLSLAPFARGEYIVEATASATAGGGRKLVAFRVE